MSNTPSNSFPETADIETASAGYAGRFDSAAGRWMLGEQTRYLREGLASIPTDAPLLDVGGGHAQVAEPLRADGRDLLVTGSDPVCAERLPAGTRFEVADCLALPHPDRSMTVVTSFRLLPHCDRWPELVAELCRVADRRVVVDYPTRQSLNVLADRLFTLKKKVEQNTRPFTLFSHREIEDAFAAHGFRVVSRRPQFFWPMVVHRMLNCPPVSRVLEFPCRLLGLTRLWGSPVVLTVERFPS